MIVATGAGGQVGRALAALGARVLDRAACDLSDPAGAAEAIRALRPRAVVNAAAYTAVDRAEEDEALALAVNGTAPGALARACAEMGVPFVQISTDYVFDGGAGAPFAPDAPARPLGAYGRTKLAGERAVREAGGTYAILRTSWVFGPDGANFVRTMLRLGAERDRVRVVADQRGGPTPARAIAEACLRIAETITPAQSGAYNFAGAPDVSWADFARAIFQEAGLRCAVEDIPSSEYPTPARRPSDSRLDCASTKAAFGLDRPPWREGLRRTLEELR